MRLLQQRTAVFLVTVWLIFTIAFLCVYRLPGDPARMILGRQASQESVDNFKHYAGLDQPIWRQYATFLRRAATAEFGDSLLYRRPVTELIRERSRLTLLLVL